MRDFTKKEIEIISKALIEYENNNYESEDNEWQETINNLITHFKGL